MNLEDRPERVLDAYRDLQPVTGMEYAANGQSISFTDNDTTQSIRFTSGDHTVALRGTPSLHHIISKAEEGEHDPRPALEERINQYPDIERGAIDIQNLDTRTNGPLKDLTESIHNQQLAWSQPYALTYDGEEALDHNHVQPPEDKNKENEATQIKLRRRIAKRCYAVSLLFEGVNNVLDDMMNRLTADQQLLSVHNDNENGIDVINDALYERRLRGEVYEAREELASVHQHIDVYKEAAESRAQSLVEKLPTKKRNRVKGSYRDASRAFS